MTKDEIKQVFMDELPQSWTFPNGEMLLDEWLDLFDLGAGYSTAWLIRMTRAVANLAMALSEYSKDPESGKREIDPPSFRLATVLVAHCCHEGAPRPEGRVCSDVTVSAYGEEAATAIRERYNLRFKESGLPLFPTGH
jgi:hypothetical protein